MTTHPLRLGNDVVDRAHPRIADDRDRSRLMDRILDPHERRWVQESDGRLRLWTVWAAKECGYKVACKWPGPRPVFRHRDFGSRLELRPDDGELFRVRGTVRVPAQGEVRLTGWASDRVIHLAGVGGDAPDAPRLELGVERVPSVEAPLATLRSHFTEREWEGVHGLASAHARLVARARLAGHLGVDESEVRILTSRSRPGRTPPRIRVAGCVIPGIDLSISHHGAWVAWALLLPSPNGVDQKSGR